MAKMVKTAKQMRMEATVTPGLEGFSVKSGLNPSPLGMIVTTSTSGDFPVHLKGFEEIMVTPRGSGR